MAVECSYIILEADFSRRGGLEHHLNLYRFLRRILHPNCATLATLFLVPYKRNLLVN